MTPAVLPRRSRLSRPHIIFIVALMALLGSLVTLAAAAIERASQLRGIEDATVSAALPFRVPLLGVNADLDQYDGDQLAQMLDRMETANIHWVRQFFDWSAIQPEADTFAWETADHIVSAFEGRDLQLVAVLMGAPLWARERDHPTSPPRAPADFARFAAAFAERYGDIIDHYQIWDEPNLGAAWGESEPRASEYTALLSAAYQAIHGVDSRAVVIAAALAPTVERGGRNISDLIFLEQMYAFGAAQYMDAAAGKPYGFNTSPADRRVDENVLNFSRLIALREIMITHGDARKALWASNWGWNHLPGDWPHAPSIWGAVSADERAAYTVQALQRARDEWTWVGGMILQHWQPDVPLDDPLWGFSVLQPDGIPTPLYDALVSFNVPETAINGLYPPANPYARYSGVWTFSPLGADIGWVQDSQLTFEFTGTDIALLVRQDDYVAYLYPTIDGGQPNALPRDPNGRAFINLKSASLMPELSLIPIARGLSNGTHRLHLAADRGWDRWALAGFAVGSGSLAPVYDRLIVVAALTTLIAGASVVTTGTQIDWSSPRRRLSNLWNALGAAGQWLMSIAASIALLFSITLTLNGGLEGLFRRDGLSFALALFTAGALYISPWLTLSLICIALLFIIIYHRPEMGLALTLGFAPFFLFPVDLRRFQFPLSELILLITAAAYGLRALAKYKQRGVLGITHPRRWSGIDLALTAYLALGALALLWSDQRRPAITEFRTLFVEPVIFYLLVRRIVRDQRTLLLLADATLVGGAAVAVIGLYLFVTGQSIITAEEGALRLASVYGSPNNAALFLGRCIPFTLAFAFVPLDKPRRMIAVVLTGLFIVTVFFTQSAGALLLGLPVGICVVIVLFFRRRAWLPLLGLAVCALIAAVLLSNSPRFARIINFDDGTNFFRIRVWQSALNMIADHPLTGVGLDQFLYAFRGRYIMPDAWQEPDLSHPHNILLDHWTRLGLLGVALLIGTQAVFWRKLRQAWRVREKLFPLLYALLVGTAGSMAGTLAHGLVDNSIFVHDLIYVFALSLFIAHYLAASALPAGDQAAVVNS